MHLATIVSGVIFSKLPILRDLSNTLMYGLLAPRSYERIWIQPRDCTQSIHSKYVANIDPNYCSAFVVDDWPISNVTPTIELPRIDFCIKHWQDGHSWESTGAYTRIREKIIRGFPSDHGIITEHDIVSRYQKLDSIFNKIKAEGKFMLRGDLIPGNFREKGSVLIHLGPNGVPFFGLKGHHRFAIAYILGIPIPAQIGIVHVSALGILEKMRHKSTALE